MCPKVSVLKKRGHFFYQKVSGKGSLNFGERSYVPTFAVELRDRGV